MFWYYISTTAHNLDERREEQISKLKVVNILQPKKKNKKKKNSKRMHCTQIFPLGITALAIFIKMQACNHGS